MYEIVYPIERFKTYAGEFDVSDAVLRHEGEGRVLDLLREQAKRKAEQEARKIDRDAPLIVVLEHIEEQPSPDAYTRRWRIFVRVEFEAYVRAHLPLNS